MVNILKVGHGLCEHCDEPKKKKGAEIQTYGYAIRPTAVGTSGKTGEKTVHEGYRFAWSEQIFLCTRHLRVAMAVAQALHDMVESGQLVVNCESKEEAEKRIQDIENRKASA